MSIELYIKLNELIEQAEEELLTQQDGSIEKQKTLRRLELLEDRIEALPPEILAQFVDKTSDDESETLDNSNDGDAELDIDSDVFKEVEESAQSNDLPHSFDAEINKEIDLSLEDSKAPTSVLSAAAKKVSSDANSDTVIQIKYAAERKPVKGQYELGCIGIVWANGKKPKGSVSSMGNAVAKTTKELSGGLTTFKVTAKNIKVPYQYARKNLRKAEEYAKKVLNKSSGHSFDIYDIANSNVSGFSHAGGNTAHLQGTQIRTALHETYHLRPFQQGHAGRILPNGKLDAYGDNLSFMSRFPTNKLNAPELWNLGWPGVPNKTAIYEAGDPATQYNIEQLFYREPSDNITGVLMPKKNSAGRPMFLALYNIKEKGEQKSKPMFGLHYFTTGPGGGIGTQRIRLFKEQINYNGLSVKKVSEGNNYSTIEVFINEDGTKDISTNDTSGSRKETARL